MRRIVILLLAMLSGALAARAADSGRVHKIDMIDHQYQPRQITAKLGDTLMFINRDKDAHFVFSTTAEYSVDLRSAINRPVSNFYTHLTGDQVPMPLTKALTFRVECALHAAMLLTVTVER